MKMKYTHQNLWNIAKAGLRENFRAHTYIRKEETSQACHLGSYFKDLEKEHNKLKASRKKKIINIMQKSMKLKI